MSAQDQISRLEGLLERIRRNAVRARVPSTPEPVVQAAAPAEDDEDAVPISEDLLLDDEIVDITEEPIEEAGVAAGLDIDFEEEEEPPASSRRPKVAASMDEALAGAAELVDEREVPLKTPPPESGRQIATTPPMQQALPPEDLLEAELAAAHPTTEQLGQTIDLEEPTRTALELDEPLEQEVVVAPPEAAPEELDISLPSHAPSGVYSEALAPPPEAQHELEQHRRREAERSAPVHEIPAPPPVAEAVHVAPQIVARPAVPPGVQPSAFAAAAQSFKPATFLELLDASLALGPD